MFIYKCGRLNWAGLYASIGFQAGGNYSSIHPLSDRSFSNTVSCIKDQSPWNNILYELTSTENELESELGKLLKKTNTVYS